MGKWELVSVSEVTNILDNKRVPITASERRSGKYPYYGANGVQDYIDNFIFDDELVLLAEDGGNFGSATRPIAYRVSGKCWVNNHAHVLKPKENLDVDYVCYSIMFYDVLPLISGTTRAKLNKSALSKMLIPLPPLDIQKRIAAALDTANALIEKRKEQIEKLDFLIKSQFIEMFGDPVTNPKGWEKKKLKKECDVITGNTPSRLNLSNYGNYIEWIKSDNINTTSMYLTQAREGLSEEGLSIARSVDEGNILMTCIAGSLSCIGNVAIADRKVSFNQQINAIVPKENNHLFIYHLLLLSKPYIQGKVNMSLKGILSKGKLLELEFFFPPLSLQIQFAEFVEKVEAQKALLKKSLADMEQNYQSFMQKCFKGEIF